MRQIGERMDYVEQQREFLSVVDSVAELLRAGDNFNNAFAKAFSKSNFDHELFHQTKIGVGSMLRARRQREIKQLSLKVRVTPASKIR